MRPVIKCPTLRAAIKAMEKAEADGFDTDTIMRVLIRRKYEDGARLVRIEAQYLLMAEEIARDRRRENERKHAEWKASSGRPGCEDAERETSVSDQAAGDGEMPF